MIITIDIGNTTIAVGVMDKLKLISVHRLNTDLSVLALRNTLKALMGKIIRAQKNIKVVLISSVVPNKTAVVERLAIKSFRLDVKVIGRDLYVPLLNRYKDPKQVGQDRLLGAYAAMTLYGYPVIVIDFGTAITFDVVSPKKEYLGGVIVPGLRLSAESLFLKTALLPQIDIQAPHSVIGRTTQESILSGLFYGYGSLCQGFIGLISKQIKAHPKVVMTGGHTHLMKRFVASKIRIIDEHLVHKGMALLACEC